jgi:hypothetical protein
VHEGDEPHPILIDVKSGIDAYMAEAQARWAAYVDRVGSSDEVKVVEGCYFNNGIESLLAHNVDRPRILRYADELQALIEPLNPTLVYLVQGDVASALERSFKDRGTGFRDYVIQFATGLPLAKRRGWQGYEGMVMYWREFVTLTDELFDRHRIRKIKVDNSAGNWDDCNQQVLDCLAIPLIPELRVSPSDAARLVGLYKDRRTGREFTVQYEDGGLTINVFLGVRTKLVPRADKAFLTEGWHFDISFEPDGPSGTMVMRIGGRDVDYVRLVGTVADRASL